MGSLTKKVSRVARQHTLGRPSRRQALAPGGGWHQWIVLGMLVRAGAQDPCVSSRACVCLRTDRASMGAAGLEADLALECRACWGCTRWHKREPSATCMLFLAPSFYCLPSVAPVATFLATYKDYVKVGQRVWPCRQANLVDMRQVLRHTQQGLRHTQQGGATAHGSNGAVYTHLGSAAPEVNDLDDMGVIPSVGEALASASLAVRSPYALFMNWQCNPTADYFTSSAPLTVCIIDYS